MGKWIGSMPGRRYSLSELHWGFSLFNLLEYEMKFLSPFKLNERIISINSVSVRYLYINLLFAQYLY